MIAYDLRVLDAKRRDLFCFFEIDGASKARQARRARFKFGQYPFQAGVGNLWASVVNAAFLRCPHVP
jgi:hypothetical protein